jgi:hypothetical protein
MTPRSENTRHECFVVDASVSVKIAETAEMAEKQVRERSSDGRYWARTSDLRLVEAALSQLS